MIQRREIGQECFVINNLNLAALACSEWSVPRVIPALKTASKEFETLREKLPEWLLAVCLNGGPRMPEGKLAYEEEELRSIAAIAHLQGYNDRDLEELILAEALRPWGILKKFNVRGSVQDVSFKAPLKRVPEFQRILQEVTNKYDYPLGQVGVSVIPVERARAVQVFFDLHCNQADAQETAQVKNLWFELSERLIDEGAFFDRPYGAWSDMIYRRAGTYTQKLKEIKREIDPNHILNPGHLCF
jgi:FAD/FMN-containing dehydrogenase